ncbi:MAG TPA: FAD-dependent oxidoreductase [Bacteroidota bacterium]
MNDKKDVLIIGGGIVGLCCAYSLLKEGCSVTIFEKDDIGSGASFGNAGFVAPSHFIPLASPGMIAKGLRWMLNPESPFYVKPRFDLDLISWMWKFRAASTQAHVDRSKGLLRDLCLGSVPLYDEMSRLNGTSFFYEKIGLFMMFRTEKGRKENLGAAEIAQQIGIEAKVLDNDGMRELDPKLESKALGAVFYQQDCHIDPEQFLKKLSAYLEKNGVTIHRGAEVKAFEKKKGAVTGVVTSKGKHEADVFVLASGAWTAGMVRELNVSIPLQPAKGYSITIPSDNHPRIPLILTESKVAVTPLGDRMRFAGTLELAGISHTINQRRVNAILKAVPLYMGGFDNIDLGTATIWGGMRPCTPDGLPYVGRFHRYNNLIAATGHAMLGITLAPITGQLVAEIATEKKPSIDVAMLDPDRYG